MTLLAAMADVIRHPVDRIIRRWNWKSALLSAMLRGTLFFSAAIPNGIASAVRATTTEWAAVVPLVGVFGALIQALRCAEPAWASTLVVTLILPAITQAIEVAAHWSAHTPSLAVSELGSVVLSMVSSAFTLYLMRRDAFIVGNHASGLRHDLKRLPRLFAGFLLAPVVNGWSNREPQRWRD
jgi:hypothetical protein